METQDTNLSSVIPARSVSTSITIDAKTIVFIVALNAVITLTCACVVTCIILRTFSRRRRRRELRDKLGSIVANMYWPAETDVSQLLRTFETMRSTVLFRDVTALDVLAYKYRFSPVSTDGDHRGGTTPPLAAASLGNIDAFVTLKKIERLFDSLVLQLPIRGRQADNGKSGPIGRTLCGLARTTAPIWSDDRALVVRRLIMFFGDTQLAIAFDGSRLSDDALDRRIRTRLPYAASLILFRDRFVLSEITVPRETGAFDLRSKIRFVDERLSSIDIRSLGVECWPRFVEAYRSACDISMSYGCIPSRANFPEFPAEFPKDDEQVNECVRLLRHLVRILCGVRENIRALSVEERFLRFVAEIYGIFYAWPDAPSVVLSCVERIRANVIAYARSFTTDQLLIDPELTRSTLERVEAELYRHLDYLTVRRVQMKRHGDGRSGDTVSARVQPRSTGPDSRRPGVELGHLRPVESETSVYTMAASYIPPVKRPVTSPRRGIDFGSSSLLQQQHSTDRGSIVSCGSSLYATAASFSSEGETGSLLQSPRMRRLSPGPGACSSDSETEYFETPV